MKKTILITNLFVVMLTGATSCGYQEKGHANTPAEHPGSQTKPGTDTVAHPGNIDKDSIRLEK